MERASFSNATLLTHILSYPNRSTFETARKTIHRCIWQSSKQLILQQSLLLHKWMIMLSTWSGTDSILQPIPRQLDDMTRLTVTVLRNFLLVLPSSVHQFIIYSYSADMLLTFSVRNLHTIYICNHIVAYEFLYNCNAVGVGSGLSSGTDKWFEAS